MKSYNSWYYLDYVRFPYPHKMLEGDEENFTMYSTTFVEDMSLAQVRFKFLAKIYRYEFRGLKYVSPFGLNPYHQTYEAYIRRGSTRKEYYDDLLLMHWRIDDK